MGKVRDYIKKLTLFQQLISILLIASLLFIFIMMPLVDFNLKSIVDRHMYENIRNEQNMIMNTEVSSTLKGGQNVYHILYDDQFHRVISTNIKSYDLLQSYYQNIVKKPLEQLSQLSIDTIHGKTETIDDTYYYLITRVSQNNYLISIQNSEYSNELISEIRNQTIYIQYIFFTLISCLLVLWVLSLIAPLKKIKHYIDTIKENNECDLSIDREDEIGIVSKALVEMKDNLNKQEKIKEEMIHNISHDLKTPIALIKTYSQSVKDDIYPYDDKDTSMDIILENVDRLEHKVTSFLYLNRLDYLNGEEKQYLPIQMKILVEKIVEQMDFLNPNIALQTSLTDTSFIGNEEHWRVAIENIIENASRYAKTKIEIILKEDKLEIFNDGDPIDEELLSYLFQPYAKGNKGQFGLGLSIVYKVVHLYGYEVKAINKDNGVSFVISKHIS